MMLKSFLFFMLMLTLHNVKAQQWWNYQQIDDRFRVPDFTPLPDLRYTHETEITQRWEKATDLTVNIPKAGMGEFVGFTQHINYDYSWTSWPADSGHYINCFLGIPYAAPPLGALRFRAPQPAYLDTRFRWIAQSYKPSCLRMKGSFFESEDCLYLNIFSPNSTLFEPTDLFPVIIHIHGDIMGSNLAYQPHAIVSEGTVVVTFSYRVGVLGFLATGDFASMGNFGLLDQLMVLQWVKDNIIWFRGDSNRITIMGDGIGANYVGIHLVSPVSRGLLLFNQAILMSGSDLSPSAISSSQSVRTRQYAIELGRILNCPAAKSVQPLAEKYIFNKTFLNNRFTNRSLIADFTPEERLYAEYQSDIDTYSLLYCLRYQKSAEEIISKALEIKHLRGGPEDIWTPVVDGNAGYLPRLPKNERQAGRFMKIPIIVGITHDFASKILSEKMKEWDNFDWDRDELTEEIKFRTINRLVYFMNAYRFNETVEELSARYTWWPNRYNETARRELLVALLSDWLVIAPVHEIVRLHAQFAPTFMYEFSYRSRNDTRLSTNYGIYNGVEIPFLFGYPFMNETFWQKLRPVQYPGDMLEWMTKVNETFMKHAFNYPQDHNISQFLIKTWTNFAKFGNPTPEMYQNITWLPFSKDRDRYAHIWINSTMRYNFKSSLMAFWRERFAFVAEIFSASPPKLYYTIQELQQATIIVAGILIILLVIVGSMCFYLSRKPKPDQFRSDYRGVDPAGAFTNNFRDAYSNPSMRQKLLKPHPPPPPLPLIGSTFVLNQKPDDEISHWPDQVHNFVQDTPQILSPVYAAANYNQSSLSSARYTKLGDRKRSGQMYLNTQSPDEWCPQDEYIPSRRGSIHDISVLNNQHGLSSCKLATDV